jgi:hypothetical protein
MDNENNLWVYLSNSFENILEEKINKNTHKRFPTEFLSQVEDKIRFANRFQISLYEPVNLEILIQKLKKEDKIDNTETDFMVNFILEIANLNGISKKDMLEKITLQEYNIRFSKIGYSFLEILPYFSNSKVNINLHDAYGPTFSNYILVIICRFLYMITKKKQSNKNFNFFNKNY